MCTSKKEIQKNFDNGGSKTCVYSMVHSYKQRFTLVFIEDIKL